VVIPGGHSTGLQEAEEQDRSGILAVTRMLRRKGLQYLLEALPTGASAPPVHLVGDGPYLPRLRRLAEGLDAPITFHGWLDSESEQLRELYRSSRIFVLPSSRENFPEALLEAMAAGLAIITTSGTGTEEVVGDAAILVPPEDRESLRRAIRELEADDERCRRLGVAARRRLRERFGWDIVGDRYLDLFGSVLANRRGE
jgi:glycosyltransferase involved in cell wall biosynthesis